MNIIPMPERLEPKSRKRMLLTNVRGYFYPLYNASSPKFRNLLASVNNDTALTGNRTFDRKEAVDMIVSAAKEAKDTATAETKAGEIYRCLVHVMNEHEELKLKLRRQAYERLTQGRTLTQQAAE